MPRSKITLSVDQELLKEAKGVLAREGVSISSVVEEALESLVASKLFEKVAEELGLENLVLVNPDDILEQRPRGLEAAEVVGELRRSRSIRQVWEENRARPQEDYALNAKRAANSLPNSQLGSG